MEQFIVCLTHFSVWPFLSLLSFPICSASFLRLYFTHVYFVVCFFTVLPSPPTSYTTVMRRFSSEGSLLDLDFLPWKRVVLKKPDHGENRASGIYTLNSANDELDGRAACLTPTILEPTANPSESGRNELSRKLSISAEDMTSLGKLDKSLLGVCDISEGCRAYSDSQLAPGAQGSTESVERDDLPPMSSSSSSTAFKSQHRINRAKLSAAKLHLKTLFAQVRQQLSFSLAYRATYR